MTEVHDSTPTRTLGARLEDADCVVLCLHGRGASAGSILGLAEELPQDGVAYVAPQAERRQWYPKSFMAPVEANEPHLSGALARVDVEVEAAVDAGVKLENVVLLGFSQGACLAAEYAARNARRYSGVVCFSGGLIGDEVERGRYKGSFDGSPAFFGCSDVDPHIPVGRVEGTVDVYREMDSDVSVEIYEEMGHTVNEDEIERAAEVVEAART